MKSLRNLIIRPEKLGDLVIATPLFRAFKESYPDEELCLLTDEVFADVLRHDPHLDRIITIPWKGRHRKDRSGFMAMRAKLLGERYSRATILYSGWFGWNILCASLGITQVAQLGGTLAAPLFGHKMVLRGGMAAQIHMADWYLEIGKRLGVISSSCEPKTYITLREIEEFKSCFPYFSAHAGDSILIHLGGSPEGENVSIRFLAEWIPQISKSLNAEVFVTGSIKEEVEWNKHSGIGTHQELLGKLTIRQMMVALNLAGRVVSNSTGIVHLAAAAGTPTVGLYTADPENSVELWGPLGKNVRCITPALDIFEQARRENRQGGRVDLGQLISVEEVIIAIKELPRTEIRQAILT